jgi:flagellar protein FlaJ
VIKMISEKNKEKEVEAVKPGSIGNATKSTPQAGNKKGMFRFPFSSPPKNNAGAKDNSERKPSAAGSNIERMTTGGKTLNAQRSSQTRTKNQLLNTARTPRDTKKTKKQKGEQLAFQEKFTAISIRYFGGLATKLEDKFPKLSEDLLMSDYFVSPIALLSVVLFMVVLAIPLAVVGVVLAVIMNNIMLAVTAVVPAGIFGMGLYMPKSSRSGRANNVDSELAFVIGYLSVLISGGVSPVNLFRRLSTNKLYPACAKEARRIVINVDVLGMDPVSAIEKVARYTPNKVFGDFLAGYIAVVKIGGDVRSYMDQKQKEIFSHRSIKLKSATEFVGTLAEAYLSATVVMGISLFILQIVQAMVQKGGSMDLGMMYFYAGIFMPAISGVFIFLFHSIQTKEPANRMREHVLFMAGLAAVPIMLFVVPIDLAVYFKLGIGLAASTTAPAIIYMMHAKKKGAVESALPSFVLDMAEIRKTGMAPEKCIEQLATRNYGALTAYVRRMATQVSWGVPLSKVLNDFGKDLNSWFVRSIGFILVEVVEVGGGTVGLFGSLAEFTQKSKELDKERKSMFRPYVFMPYIGAILTVATTVFIINMMSSQVAVLAERGGTGVVSVNTDPRELTEVMLMAAIFQGWLMGIVGGKMGEWSIGAGYKHATILVIISMMTVYGIMNFVKL